MADEKKIPTRIGDYEILRSLGKGIMGEVFLGKREENVFNAIKTCNANVAQKLDYVSKFQKEIAHENILRYTDLDYDENIGHYFVSDYFEVRPVTHRRVRERGNAEVLNLFIQICEGLEYAHKNGAVHGNLKPSNLLVRRANGDLHAKVSDFGLVYIYDKERFTHSMFKQSFPYMSPEVIEFFITQKTATSLPEGIRASADIYSLGVVLCEVLTGRSLYEETELKDTQTLLNAKREKEFRLITINYPFASINIKPLNLLVKNALSYDESGRLESAAEFADVLRACRIEKEPGSGNDLSQ